MIYIITILMTTLFSSSLFSQTNCQDARQKYWILYQDVANAKHDPFDHYQVYGKNEGRVWPACKGEEEDCENARSQYYKLYPDVYKAGANAWTHYQTFGINEGRVWPFCNNRYCQTDIEGNSNRNAVCLIVGRVLSDTNFTSSIKESKNFIEIRLTNYSGHWEDTPEYFILTFNHKWKLEYIYNEYWSGQNTRILGKDSDLMLFFESLVNLNLFTLFDDAGKCKENEYFIDFENNICKRRQEHDSFSENRWGPHSVVEYKVGHLFRQYSCCSYCICDFCKDNSLLFSKIKKLFRDFLNN